MADTGSDFISICNLTFFQLEPSFHATAEAPTQRWTDGALIAHRTPSPSTALSNGLKWRGIYLQTQNAEENKNVLHHNHPRHFEVKNI